MSPDKNIIAFQGELGANSHLACKNYVPNMGVAPCATFEDVFESIASGQAQLAMIPIENTLAGRVSAVQHLLPRAKLYIIGEHFEPISFALLALPQARLEDLRFIHSHIMALDQCRKIIRELNLSPVATSDTAGAAHDVAQAQDLSKAALAPLGAAEIYGLKSLREKVEDESSNITRFLVLHRHPLEIKATEIHKKKWLTSFIFRVRHVPAALYKALGGFASNGVNMIRLESGQLDPSFTVTQFYADIEGHPSDAKVAGAMEELRFFSEHVHMLGTYPESAFRSQKV